MHGKRSKNFVPSGLDEVFERIAQRKAEAIAKGWITEGKPKSKNEPQPKPQTESAEGRK